MARTDTINTLTSMKVSNNSLYLLIFKKPNKNGGTEPSI